MENITLEDLESDQQQLIEKTDIQTLASFCQELQAHHEEIDRLETTIKEYKEIEELFKRSNSIAYVNCPGRTYDFYKSLKKTFNFNEPIQMEVIGNNWGLGCNSVHFIDLFNFFTDEIISDWENNLEASYTSSKREGYIEFFGNISGQTINKSRLSITCYKNEENTNISIRISTPNQHVIIEPAVSKVYISDKHSKWCLKEINTEFPFQSQLTQKNAKQLFEKGSCDLTPFNLSSSIHIPFIETILEHYNQYQNNTKEICPIT